MILKDLPYISNSYFDVLVLNFISLKTWPFLWQQFLAVIIYLPNKVDLQLVCRFHFSGAGVITRPNAAGFC